MDRRTHLMVTSSLICLGIGCSNDDAAEIDGGADLEDAAPTDDAAAPDAAPPQACTPLSVEDLTLELVADGLDEPLFITAPPGDARLFIVERTGNIRIVDGDGELLAEPFLSVSDRIETGFAEQGLLGLAFHPAYDDNGRLFVNYTDTAGDTVVAEYEVSGDPNVADAGSERPLLAIDQPDANHNGGMLEFGPDGFLYISTGDGGGADDQFNNAQDLSSLHGAILRIDVDAEDEPYGIPADNPFVGDDAARDEIWAYGLRNPWRFSFDRESEMIFVADVGQNSWEEVNIQPDDVGGLNYGWSCREGTNPLRSEVCDGIDTGDLVDPIHEYENTGFQGRCSVTGGYVYRGEELSSLEGLYLFADHCSSDVWVLEPCGDGDAEVENITENLDPNGDLVRIASFGEDASGEIYVTGYAAGAVYRIAAAE